MNILIIASGLVLAVQGVCGITAGAYGLGWVAFVWGVLSCAIGGYYRVTERKEK